jgi:hypothetical protein
LISGRRAEIVPLDSLRTFPAMRALATVKSFAAFDAWSFPWSLLDRRFRFRAGKL